MPFAWPALKFLLRVVLPNIPEVVSTIAAVKKSQEAQNPYGATHDRLAELERSLALQSQVIDQITSQLILFEKFMRRVFLLAIAASALALVSIGVLIYQSA